MNPSESKPSIWSRKPRKRGAARLATAKVLTTGQCAKVMNIAPRTVSKLIDSGRLKGYRVPGSNDRRVVRSVLVDFMRAHNFPMEMIEPQAEQPFRVLIVSRDTSLSAAVRAFLLAQKESSSLRTECAAAVDFFDAGILCEDLKPDVVICDFNLGRTESENLRYYLRRREEQPSRDGTARKRVGLIALVGEDEADEQPGWDDCFKRPFDPELLAQSVVSMGGGK